jgi:hypothetical protein
MDKLVFDVPYIHVYEPTAVQIDAASKALGDIKDKPRFCVDMMLAVLDKPNANNHRLKRVEADKALASLGDKLNVPGNLDHSTGAYGTSISLFVVDKNKALPELWLSAVYWRRYISDVQMEEIISAANRGTLGASWEIDENHYKLEADKENPKILDVKDFSIDGFGLMVGKTPAEIKTQGTATITAQELDSGDEVVKVDTYGELRLDMLRSVRCPTCGSRGRLRKLNFVDGIFEMECLNGEFDSDKISHIYEVSIAVKPRGQAAEYVLTATKEAAEDYKENDEVVKVEFKQTNEEVYDMEFTDENKREIAAEVDAKVKAILADQKKTADDLATEKADAEVEVEKRIKEAEEKARTAAVEAYKATQALAAKRIDELGTIMPYASEEEKVADQSKLAAMTDERYAEYKERREMLAKIAELTKKPEGEEDPGAEGEDDGSTGEETPAVDAEKLPAGKIQASEVKDDSDALSALDMI